MGQVISARAANSSPRPCTILFGVSLLPFAIRMSGALYLAAAVVLGGVFIAYAVRIYAAYSDRLARQTFRYSIFYLAALFAALLLDHHL